MQRTTDGAVRPLAGQFSREGDVADRTRAVALELLQACRKSGSLANRATALDKSAAALQVALEVERDPLNRARIVAHTDKTIQETKSGSMRERRRANLMALTPLASVVALAFSPNARCMRAFSFPSRGLERAVRATGRRDPLPLALSSAPFRY